MKTYLKYFFLISFLIAGFFVLLPKTALAEESIGAGHSPIEKIAGSATATTTVKFIAFAGPSGNPYLELRAFWQNGSDPWASTTCSNIGDPVFECILTNALKAGADGRIWKYFLEVYNSSTTQYAWFAPFAPIQPVTSRAEAETYPIKTTVYNAPNWTNTFFGQYSTSTPWAGVKDGTTYKLATNTPSGTNQILLNFPTEVPSVSQVNPGDWINIAPADQTKAEKFGVIATTTQNGFLKWTLSASTTVPHAAGVKVHKFIAGAYVWVGGMAGYTTTSDAANTNYGTFLLQNIPDGTWDIVAAKQGYCPVGNPGYSAIGPSTTTVELLLPTGGCKMEPAMVVWTAPYPGMMGAPRNISATTSDVRAPILIGFKQPMSSSTIEATYTAGVTDISTLNIRLWKEKYNATTSVYELVAPGISYSVIYDDGISPHPFSFNFGPGPKAIIYTAPGVLLDANTWYGVELTNAVKDADGTLLGSGGYQFGFSTAPNVPTITSGTYATGGMLMPPFIKGVIPGPGMFNAPQNTKVLIKFDQAMDPASTSSSTIKVFKLDANYNEVSEVSVSTSTLDTMTKSIALLSPASNFSQGMYRIKVLGGVKSATGISMAKPGYETNVMFMSEFEVGTAVDSASPQVWTGFDMYYYNPSTGQYEGIPVSVVLEVGFSEPIDPDTVNTDTIYLKSGTTKVLGSGSYDPIMGMGKLVFDSALNASSTHVLTFTSGIKDLAGNSLATTTKTFVTGFPDTQSPRIEFGNCDDYTCAVTFSEPMNAVGASDVTKGASSVLNPKNYILWIDDFAPWETPKHLVKYYGHNNLAEVTEVPLTFTYDAASRTVIIKGFNLMVTQSGLDFNGGFRLWIATSTTDLSGNTIGGKIPANSTQANDSTYLQANNTAGGPIMSSINTFGMMGPGPVGMFAPPSTTTEFVVTDFGGKDPMIMGMMPVGVWPMSMMAGAISRYMVDLPIATSSIPVNGKIVLTFPSGFDVSGVKDGDSDKKFAHYDINGPGPGIIQISTTTASGQIVTITLNATTSAPDFLHIELDGIRNSYIPKDFGTAGYSVDIKTISAKGRVLESKTSMPFFITKGGDNVLSGTISFKADSSYVAVTTTVPLFLGSPVTGPMPKEVRLANATSTTYSFTGLPDGDYFFFVESVNTPSGTTTDYYADFEFEPFFLTASTTKNITFSAQTGTTNKLVVKIFGTFANEDVDIFAGGPAGFRVKTVILNQTAATTSHNFYLPGNGTFMVGIGPAMPRGPIPMGSLKMPDWMPPKPAEVVVTSGTAAPAEVTFAVTTGNYTISGQVLDGAGKAVSNAGVFGYSPEGMFGTHTKADTSGNFTTPKVPDGIYKVGAFMPGMPSSQERAVEVKGANVTGITLTLAKPEYTISGKVTDGTNVVTDASVYAYRTDGPGHAETMTDSMGMYILYVNPGTWKVGAFIPGYGDLLEKTIVVPPSKSGLNFAPVTTISVKGRVYEDVNGNSTYDSGTDNPLPDVHVMFEKAGYIADSVTNATGTYKLNLATSTDPYNLSAWDPKYGKLSPKSLTVTAAIDVGGTADITVPIIKEVKINFKNSSGNPITVEEVLVQLDRENTKDISNEAIKEDISEIRLKAASSTNDYILDIDIPGIPDNELVITPTDPATTTVSTSTVGGINFAKVLVNGDEEIDVILPDIHTVSGTIKDTAGNSVPDAVVHIENPTTGVELDVKANSSGDYSVKLASSSEPYLIQADKQGYLDEVPSPVILNAATTTNLEMKAATRKIKGKVSVGAAPADRAYAFAEKLGGGFVSAQANTAGDYELLVPDNGDYEVSAIVDGYQGKTQPLIASVSGADVSGLNLSLDTAKALKKPKAENITPVVGGTLGNAEADFEMSVPPSALGTESSVYQVKEKETSNIPPFTPTSEVIGDKAEEIRAYNPTTKEQITALKNKVAVDKTYTKAELAADGINTIAKIEKIKMASYDDTAQNWVNLPTNITYLDANEKAVIPADADFSNVAKVLFNGMTSHFSAVGVTNSLPDGLAPSAPTGIAITNATERIHVSWIAPTTNRDGSTLTDLRGYNIYRSTSSNGPWTRLNTTLLTDLTYTDGNVAIGTTYYYRVTADTGIVSLFSLASVGGVAFAAVGGGGGGDYTYVPLVEKKVVVEKEVIKKPIAEMTIEKLKAEITRITALIKELQTQLAALLGKALIEGVPADFKFEKTFKYGQVSTDVKYLQIVLNSDSETRLAESGVGSPGQETNYFGSITKVAVIKFQEKYAQDILSPWGITKGTGIVGKITRAKLNELLGK